MRLDTNDILKKYDYIMKKAIDSNDPNIGSIEILILRAWILQGILDYKQRSEVKTQ